MSRKITQKQIDYINDLAEQNLVFADDVSDIIYQLYNTLTEVEDLTMEQASEVIDELKIIGGE